MKKISKRNKQFILRENNFLTLIISVVILFPCVSFAQFKTPIEEVIFQLQQTYEKTQDFKASFIQESTLKSIKKTEVESGLVYFKNPKNMLWDYTQPKAKKMVINPQRVWLYIPAEKTAYTQTADYIFKSKVLIKFLSGLGKLKDDFVIEYSGSGGLDKDGNYLLSLAPREKNSFLNPFSITVDKNSFLIVRISFEDALGNSTVLKFSNISVNTGLSEKLFQFQPPVGVDIFNMP